MATITNNDLLQASSENEGAQQQNVVSKSGEIRHNIRSHLSVSFQNEAEDITYAGHHQVTSRNDNMLKASNDVASTEITSTSTRVVIPQTNRDELTDERLLEDTRQVPQRPQDLINKVSVAVTNVNQTSNAQYRKSYAFKIWRDKGFFPYRLVKDSLFEKRRQKSKKHLNALKAQRERHDEEAWKEFKKSRVTNQEKQRSPTVKRFVPIRTQESSQHQLNSPPVSLSNTDEVIAVSTNPPRQNSIPQYFKTKKVSSIKPVCISKSVPTSVIHLNSPNSSSSSVTTSSIICDPDKEAEPLDNHTRSHSVINGSPCLAKTKLSTLRSEITSEKPSCVNTADKLENEKNLNKTPEAQALTTNTHTFTTNYSAQDLPESSDEVVTVENKRENQNSESKSATKTTRETLSLDLDLGSLIKNNLTKKYCKENVKPDVKHGAARSNKRRRESFGQETEICRGKVKAKKATVFSQLDETVAADLAEGIHCVNSEYFPIDALANKAAKEATTDMLQCEPEQLSLQKKLEDINKARVLLKELFDVTGSDNDHAMKTFDDESRSFGRRNILNHLSLLDRYFYEFQKRLANDEKHLG